MTMQPNEITEVLNRPLSQELLAREVHPPKILLIRGRAELDAVDGIPDEYLKVTGAYEMTPEQRSSGRPRSARSTTAWSGSS